MTNSYKLGPWSQQRGYFEADTLFHDPMAEKVLVAFEEACRDAARSAKYAISTGKLEDLRHAQWDHCVVETLISVLRIFPYTSESAGGAVRGDKTIELPCEPKFDGR